MEQDIMQSVTDSRDLTWVPEYSWLVDEYDLIEFEYMPVGEMLWKYTMHLPDTCLDHDDAFNDQGDMIFQQFANSVKHRFANESLSSCQDATPFCGAEQNYLVR